jgi:hypothetical protein
MVPFRGMLLTLRGGSQSLAPKAHQVPVYLRMFPSFLLAAFTAHIVDSPSQAAPQFRSHRLYTRLTAAEVRRQLIAQKGYPDAVLPTAETIGTKLNVLGYYPQKVAKSQPQKNSPKPTRSLTR